MQSNSFRSKDQTVRHVVAVANVRHPETSQTTKAFLERYLSAFNEDEEKVVDAA